MDIKKELSKGSSALLVLSVLADADRYGYQIIKEIELRSEHVFSFKEGTLYPLLTRLKKDGLLSYEWRESTQGPPRKYYALTPDGDAFLDGLDSAWNELAATVDHLKTGGPATLQQE